MLEYGNIGMPAYANTPSADKVGKAEYRLWEGHASACLGRADARPSGGLPDGNPLFQHSTIPVFHFRYSCVSSIYGALK
jgi:hypothetical protein